MNNTLKRMAGAVREYKKQAILSPLFIAGEVVFECIVPLITAELINSIERAEGMEPILRYGIELLVIAMLALFCGVTSGRYAATATAGFAKNLRHDLFARVQDFSFTNIDKFSTPSLVSRMTTDITNVQMAFMMLIRIAFRAPLMLIFAVVMSISVGRRLALIFAITLPLLAGGMAIMIRVTMPIFRRIFKKYDDLNESVQENVKAMRVVKSFVREGYEQDKFRDASENIRREFVHVEKIMAFLQPLNQLAIYTGMILISFFASYLIVSSGGLYIDVGSLTSMITYSMQVMMSLMMLSMVIVMLTMAGESAHRIAEVLDEKTSIANREDPVMTVPEGSIAFENVSFKYSEGASEYALSNISLEIPSGATVGILGSTGSGKSSLVQLIPRLYDVTEGAVRVGGIDVRDYEIDVLRGEVAMVLQKNTLFSGTIKENLRWGNENASDEEIRHACRLAQAEEFIESFPKKYDTLIEQGGNNVSGGQKQRLCIARALLKKPKILILDDSTSAVDMKTDALIREAFKNEIPDTTKLIIAQRIASVQDADIIIVLERGRIEAVGSHSELMERSPIYREVYESQNKGGSEDGGK